MVRSAPLVFVACLLAGCVAADAPRPAVTTAPATTQPNAAAAAAAVDPIDRLVEQLSSTHGLWQNGISPALDLPGTASTEQVVALVFEKWGFDAGHVKQHRILETRQVRIAGSLPDVYTAVLVDTDMGRKIVLIQGTGTNPKWWSRVYDVRTSA
jgi:hypothetical protein